jgi:putative transposase
VPGLIREEIAVNGFTTEATEAMIDPVTGEIIDQKDLAERLLAQPKSKA